MLEWLKDKVKQGGDAGQKVVIGRALGLHFAPLENAKGGLPGIADRLAQFVVDGEDQGSVRDLAAHRTRPGVFYFSGGKDSFRKVWQNC